MLTASKYICLMCVCVFFLCHGKSKKDLCKLFSAIWLKVNPQRFDPCTLPPLSLFLRNNRSSVQQWCLISALMVQQCGEIANKYTQTLKWNVNVAWLYQSTYRVYFFLQSNISHMQRCNDCFNHSSSANPSGPYIYTGIKWDQLRWLYTVDFKLNFKYICAVFGGVLICYSYTTLELFFF